MCGDGGVKNTLGDFENSIDERLLTQVEAHKLEKRLSFTTGRRRIGTSEDLRSWQDS